MILNQSNVDVNNWEPGDRIGSEVFEHILMILMILTGVDENCINHVKQESSMELAMVFHPLPLFQVSLFWCKFIYIQRNEIIQKMATNVKILQWWLVL